MRHDRSRATAPNRGQVLVDLRGRGHPADDAVGRRGRRLLVLGQHAARPARRRCRRPRRRGHAARAARADAYQLAYDEAKRQRVRPGCRHRHHAAPGPGRPAPAQRHDQRPDRHVLHARHRDQHRSAITRDAKAEFILPVPMGSPQNYYGVGFYESKAGVLGVHDPGGGTLASQGFWGAIFTSGGLRENGDRYAPKYIGERRVRVRQGRPQPRLRRRRLRLHRRGRAGRARSGSSTRSSARPAATATAARTAPATTGRTPPGRSSRPSR